MKKIITISLIMLVLVSTLTNIHAASCTVTLQPSNGKVESNKEFTVDVNLSNIQDEKGMITFTARLEYDHTNLTFKKIEGQNGWNPAYNEENGKIAAERAGGYTKDNETVFTVTFLANGAVNANPNITLTDIVFSNGTEDIDVTIASTTITIIEVENQGGNQGENQGGNQGGNQNTNRVDTSIKDGKLPQTGEMDTLLIAIAVASVLVVGFFIKIKLIDNKVNKN